MTSCDGGDAEVRLGALEDLVGYHLRRASAVIAADFTRTMGDLALRQVLFGILSIVEANPGIAQGAVGRALGIQRANMVSLVNELTDRGLIQRETAAEDRRALALSLTDEGHALFVEGHARLRAHEAALLGMLSADERTRLLALLSRIEAADDLKAGCASA